MIISTKNTHQGFSLIEVLIASFITFISLSVFTLVFRGAILSTDKAEESVIGSSVARLAANQISAEIRSNHAKSSLSGSGIALGANYSWQAQVISVAKPPARFEGTELTQADHRLKKWQVSFQITYQDSSSNFQYEELSW